MKEWVDSLMGGPQGALVYLGFMLTACLAILGFIAVTVMFLAWLERKVAGHVQSRVGPMRVGGWHGWAQSLADGIKLLLKEDTMPATADAVLFKMAPYIVFTGSLMAFAVIAWGGKLIAADLNIGVFYILAVTSLNVVGTLMAGWGSNNKWALYGAMRGVAQIVSYELPAALSIVAVVMWVGSLQLTHFNEMQAGWFWNWNALKGVPFLTIGAVVFFIASLAETNRV
ncbi:MAG: NADH-quinone oxidoreductase subunit H, partial [Candidatus Eiseniibacteriota bacterium]